jgi:hypothetical protein
MDTRYRSDYAGEFVISQGRWTGGHKQQKREWIANPIENQHISGRAACISGMVDQARFDYTRLQRHRGGLLGSLKLQTYGTGEVANQMRLDFCVETRPEALANLINSGYQTENVVYTTARNCVDNPGEFYLIPHNTRLLDLATILYLAAFDGHQEIFMLGYHIETPVQNPNWINHVQTVIDAYPSTVFWLVGESTNMPDSWMDASNTKCLTYREFIVYADV